MRWSKKNDLLHVVRASAGEQARDGECPSATAGAKRDLSPLNGRIKGERAALLVRKSRHVWRGVGCRWFAERIGRSGEDRFSSLGPDERLGVGVMGFDEHLDGRCKLGDAAKRAATDVLHRRLGEAAFHDAQPRAMRRREVDVEARAFSEPASNQLGISAVLRVP